MKRLITTGIVGIAGIVSLSACGTSQPAGDGNTATSASAGQAAHTDGLTVEQENDALRFGCRIIEQGMAAGESVQIINYNVKVAQFENAKFRVVSRNNPMSNAQYWAFCGFSSDQYEMNGNRPTSTLAPDAAPAPTTAPNVALPGAKETGKDPMNDWIKQIQGPAPYDQSEATTRYVISLSTTPTAEDICRSMFEAYDKHIPAEKWADDLAFSWSTTQMASEMISVGTSPIEVAHSIGTTCFDTAPATRDPHASGSVTTDTTKSDTVSKPPSLPADALPALDKLTEVNGAWSSLRQNVVATETLHDSAVDVVQAARRSCEAWRGVAPTESARSCRLGNLVVPALTGDTREKSGWMSDSMDAAVRQIDEQVQPAINDLWSAQSAYDN